MLTWFVALSVEGGDLLELFDWLSIVWQHLNEILEDFCDADSTIGINKCVCVELIYINRFIM